jgi:hypothetical protein
MEKESFFKDCKKSIVHMSHYLRGPWIYKDRFAGVTHPGRDANRSRFTARLQVCRTNS